MQNTHASLRRRHDWAGVSCLVHDVRWNATGGWTRFEFGHPTLCILLEEVGGRAELRPNPEVPPDGEYFGAGHLTLLAATEPICLYSASTREAEFACFNLRPTEADCLTIEQSELICSAPSRLMFQDNKLHECARMLGAFENDDPNDAYGRGLRQALLAALVGAVRDRTMSSVYRLTGEPLARVLNHIVEHLDQRISNEVLAQLADIPPNDFGNLFRAATGLSPQRWQMDARVRSAQRLMVDDPAVPLASIAKRAGFADQSHFSRAFLEILGSTPTAWLHQRR